MTRQQRQELRIFGEAVREIRMQRGFSARDLSADAGVPLGRLAALESGRLDPDLELLRALARSLGVRHSAFYVRADELAEETVDDT